MSQSIYVGHQNAYSKIFFCYSRHWIFYQPGEEVSPLRMRPFVRVFQRHCGTSVTVTNPHFCKINNRAVRWRLAILVIKCDGQGPLSKFCSAGELTHVGIFTVLEKSGCRIRGFQSHMFKRGSFMQRMKELQSIVASVLNKQTPRPLPRVHRDSVTFF